VPGRLLNVCGFAYRAVLQLRGALLGKLQRVDRGMMICRKPHDSGLVIRQQMQKMHIISAFTIVYHRAQP
jgi:hypothetical protein